MLILYIKTKNQPLILGEKTEIIREAHRQACQKSRLKHRDWDLARKKKRINFKGKLVELEKNPRIGICSQCGKSVKKGEIKRTNLHHTKYDESDPLKYTIELCISCHNKIHPEKYSNRTLKKLERIDKFGK